MSVTAAQLTDTRSLSGLLAGFADAPDIPVGGIASDSRKLDSGFLFLACEGMNSHGLDYLSEARDAGVAAVAWDKSDSRQPVDIGVPMIGVDNLSNYLGEIANRYFDCPSERLRVIAVTGTNGKTTVAWLLAQSLQLLGDRCAYIGTLGKGIDEVSRGSGMTTPAAIELHEMLAQFVADDATSVALEVSSHGLSQGRVDGVQFEAALFTNLTHDHLDYHTDLRSYFETKARLFLQCDPKCKIINVDSEFGAELAQRCGENVIAVSTRRGEDLASKKFVGIKSLVATAAGFDIAVNSSWGDATFVLSLPGDFNVDNAMLVLAYLLHSGVGIEKACDALQLVTAPAGRMQAVPCSGAAVFVDYAHTPDALASALRALRPHGDGALWCVFGCGGDRDADKRPLMAAAAIEFADRVVVTTDNPRSEAPADIIADVVAGAATSKKLAIIEDRATAIAWALSNAAANDVVLIAGKGHEEYQEVAGARAPFSDYLVALQAANSMECKE